MRNNHLYVKVEKCECHKTKIAFLGYIIDPVGVQMDEEKVTAVRDWPIPKSVKKLQRLLGFANFYRQFIRNFCKIAAPLTNLTKEAKRKMRWNQKAEEAFFKLKGAFISAFILKHSEHPKEAIHSGS